MREVTGVIAILLAGFGLCFSEGIASTASGIGFEDLEELMMVGAAETGPHAVSRSSEQPPHGPPPDPAVAPVWDAAASPSSVPGRGSR